MKHLKKIKDERGKIEITVTLWVENMSWNDNAHRWSYLVYHTPPRKIKAIQNNEIATPEEILEAKIELWNQIKPQ